VGVADGFVLGVAFGCVAAAFGPLSSLLLQAMRAKPAAIVTIEMPSFSQVSCGIT
jgi:hypothetical protein